MNHALAAPVRTRLYTAAIPGAWLLLGLAARAQNSGVTISIDVSAGRHRIDLGERGDTFFSTSRPANARQV